ncbi:MAG: hypothetical protein PHI12_11400 [Dehalococcoidales bacterium]|nr:hypothetical protein [Dehalococcoidales bacterium]
MSSSILTESQGIFAAAVALIAISISVLYPSWRTINDILSSLPANGKKLRWNFRDITDDREKDKATILLIFFMGIVFFVLAVFSGLFAMMGVASQMIGYHFGFTQQENYDFGKWCLYISIFMLFLGFFATGLIYGIKLISLINGKPDPTTTSISQIKPLEHEDIAKRKGIVRQFILLIAILFITALVLETFNWFSDSINALITLSILILVYVFIAKLGKCKAFSWFRNLRHRDSNRGSR